MDLLVRNSTRFGQNLFAVNSAVQVVEKFHLDLIFEKTVLIFQDQNLAFTLSEFSNLINV